MNPEEWRPIPGWPNYEASSFGRIRSKRTGLPIYARPQHQGYLEVSLYRQGVRHKLKLHRLVCLAFHGEPPPGKTLCRHGPNGRGDNTPRNLCWGDDAENYADRITNGEVRALDALAHRPGEGHRFARITAADVLAIREAAGNEPTSSLASRFGISRGHVSDIIRRRKWGHL